MTNEFVKVRYEANIATLTLNRPPLNVMNLEMTEQINAFLEKREPAWRDA